MSTQPRDKHTSSRFDGNGALDLSFPKGDTEGAERLLREVMRDHYAPSGRCDACVHGKAWEALCSWCRIEMLEEDIELSRLAAKVILTQPEHRDVKEIVKVFAWIRRGE